MSTAADLSTILSGLRLPPDSRAILLERFAQTLELVNAGEDGVGLENLCDNLFDFEVGLSRDQRDRLVSLCRQHGVGAHRIALLDKLVANPSGTPA
jgi:hypothetical protein